MTWEQRYRLRLTIHKSLVLGPTLSLVVALLSAPAVRWLDRQLGWTLFGFSPDGARAVLGAFASSMLTFIVFVLSAMLIVVQLASGQLTPRIIGFVFSNPRIKFALNFLTFTYTYTISTLSRVEADMPEIPVAVAVLCNLASIVGFFLFVQQLSSELRPAGMMREVANRSRSVIEAVYPLPYTPGQAEATGGGPADSPPGQVVVSAGPSGVLMAFSVGEVTALAREAQAVVELVPQVGDFVATGTPLFRVRGGKGPIPPASLLGCAAIGPERTLEQDPRFAFRILVDIASKALSPGINDPTTAVTALDQIHHLLLILGQRQLDEGCVRDGRGVVRLRYGTPNWADYVTLAVSEIRHYGAGSLQVDRRLRAMLEHLIAALPEERRPALQAELDLLGSAVARGFQDEADRKLATVGDCQGVGGSKR
ncbi:MAG: DUF2254 domain-containing protein [Gemmataceae bacterium]